jgi:hypothetical protein
MQRFLAIDNLQNAIDQSLPSTIVEIPESDSASQMAIVIRIATRASKRALLRDFDR